MSPSLAVPSGSCTTQRKGPDATGHTGAPAGRCGPGWLGNGHSEASLSWHSYTKSAAWSPREVTGSSPCCSGLGIGQKWENGDPRPQDLVLPGYCAHGRAEALPAFCPSGPSETPGWAGKGFSWSDPPVPPLDDWLKGVRGRGHTGDSPLPSGLSLLQSPPTWWGPQGPSPSPWPWLSVWECRGQEAREEARNDKKSGACQDIPETLPGTSLSNTRTAPGAL